MNSQADVPSTRTLPALAELQARPQWVCWRTERRQRKLTKVPYSATTGTHAQSDNPQTWASYAQAVQAKRARRYDGVGYMFRQDYTGVDLDHLVNENGRTPPWPGSSLDQLQATQSTHRATPGSTSSCGEPS